MMGIDEANENQEQTEAQTLARTQSEEGDDDEKKEKIVSKHNENVMEFQLVDRGERRREKESFCWIIV